MRVLGLEDVVGAVADWKIAILALILVGAGKNVVSPSKFSLHLDAGACIFSPSL